MIYSIMFRNSKLGYFVIKIISIIVFFIVAIVLLIDSINEDAVFAQNTQSSSNASKPEMASNNASFVKKTDKSNLTREGTSMQSQLMVFRVSNERTIMTVANGTERYICLENLNLQRITDVLKDNPTLTDWTVDFVVTEYRSMNYALIQRAVLSSASQRMSDQK